MKKQFDEADILQKAETLGTLQSVGLVFIHLHSRSFFRKSRCATMVFGQGLQLILQYVSGPALRAMTYMAKSPAVAFVFSCQLLYSSCPNKFSVVCRQVV